MTTVDFNKMLICDIIRQQQLAAQEIDEGDMFVGGLIIGQRLHDLKAKVHTNTFQKYIKNS